MIFWRKSYIMTGKRWIWLVMVLVALSMFLSFVWERLNSAEGFEKEIQGSGGVSGQNGTLFVSPDEEWITFVLDNEYGFPSGLVSINMETGFRTEHSLPKELSTSESGVGIDPFLEIATVHGQVAGWSDGRLYLSAPVYRYGAWCIDNQKTLIGLCDLPKAPLLLSDGLSWGAWYKKIGPGKLSGVPLSGDYFYVKNCSTVWAGDHYLDETYVYLSEYHGIFLYKDGKKRHLIQKTPKDGFLKTKYFGVLKVSPGGRYLAYTYSSKPKYFPSPFNDDVLTIIDLQSGETKLVCKERVIGNLVWGIDGGRLFFTKHRWEDGAIFVVETSEIFPE